MRVAGGIGAPRIEVRSSPALVTCKPSWSWMGCAASGSWMGLGLSAVIEEANGRKSYWALAHPPGKADFHHADCFAELPTANAHEIWHRSTARRTRAARAAHGRRVALLAHPASVTHDLTHSLDALPPATTCKLTAAFGPQHGLRGDKQDNMIESPDFNDPVHGIPVFSLYGEVRRPTDAMMDTFDVLLVDLQDLGCRIYTFITTLRYVLEAAAKHRKAVWVLDRPESGGPAGRRADAARRLGELCRRRAACRCVMGSRSANWARGSSKRSSSMSTIASSRCKAGSPMPRRASAGRSASAPGSIPVPMRRTCGWRAPMPAR